MMKVKASTYLSIVVYRSLNEAWKTLTRPELKNLPQVKSLVTTCQKIGIVEVKDDEVIPIALETPKRKFGSPFIVVEGLDGTGKTTLTNFLASKLKMKKMSTPPKLDSFQSSRNFFDDQSESVRRAYYSIGNYLAAKDVIDSPEPVVMDRYWHSTASYAFAHHLKADGDVSHAGQIEKSEFIWPADLLQPDLVVFLTVSEQERLRRHTDRTDFTNTEEEKILAADSAFRKNLVQCYQEIVGPQFKQLMVDGEQADSQQKILQCVTDYFPNLRSQ